MNATTEWIARSVSRLRKPATAPAPAPAAKAVAPERNTHERLRTAMRQAPEVLSPRLLRRVLTELQAVADPQISEVEAGRRAQAVAERYTAAAVDERAEYWRLLAEQFAPDADKLRSAREQYEATAGTAEQGQSEVSLRRAMASPRARLLQRFAAYPGGLRFLVDLRAERGLLPLDVELEHLFSTWFDVAFLELQRITWDSPASLIEKLIKYEAVHDIRGWGDAKNRLRTDRRCYGFFHPHLAGEPLIFVEVALVDQISDCIVPLLDEAAAPADAQKATTAIFYSISNTQTGLKGVSFGDALIKHVVHMLQEEFPRLKQFATLSPIPGFRAWLGKNAGSVLQRIDAKQRTALAKALNADAGEVEAPQLVQAAESVLDLGPKSPVRQLLLQCAAQYLGREMPDGRPADAVARFHLGNGARVERLNWAGDPSPKGLKQSYGLMVNYLYDLKRLDKHRGLLAKGAVPVSGDIEALFVK